MAVIRREAIHTNAEVDDIPDVDDVVVDDVVDVVDVDHVDVVAETDHVVDINDSSVVI